MNEAKASLNNTKKLLKAEFSFDAIYKMVGEIQKTKVDLALVNSTLTQLEQLMRQLSSSKPAVSCNFNESLKLVKNLMKAKLLEDVLKIKMQIEKFGGKDKLVKCIIKGEIERMEREFPKFKKWVLNEVSKIQRELKPYEELVKYGGIG